MMLSIQTKSVRWQLRIGDHRLDPYYGKEASSLLKYVPFWSPDDRALLNHVAGGGHVTSREVAQFYACRSHFYDLFREGTL
ncbi:hypothetical protein [Qipengyuania huizhouensis]|uniref:hypothetical protein n=1 Tax=Qipengyuania huizhouensis TaxID=2867245 RepID=UPI001C86EF87|nr:hypothetical protein [Qipengyuania huizhouensis]MBX7461772.1 hypothetical protein [Qipengyuania huizhouensis]